MSQCEAHLCASEEGLRVPDHSVLMWDLWVDDSMANLTVTPDKVDGNDAHKSMWFRKGTCRGRQNLLRAS